MTSRCTECGLTDRYGLKFGLCSACDDDLYENPSPEKLIEQIIEELRFTMELQQRKDAA